MVFIDKEQIKDNFGQGSSTYDQYAKVQKIMARKLLAQIAAEEKEFKNILEIGCGTGFLTEGLARGFPQSRIVAVDISPQMIEVAKKKLAYYTNITYLLEDGENLQVNTSFDLIVSSAVFQWFDNYLKPFTRYYNILKEDGMFIFNTLGEKTFCELGKALASLGKNLPRKSFINAKELEQVLSACGFKNFRVEEELHRDYYQSAKELFLGIKKIGANSHAMVPEGTYLQGGDIFKLVKFFDSNCSHEKKVYISYQAIYGYARKDLS